MKVTVTLKAVMKERQEKTALLQIKTGFGDPEIRVHDKAIVDLTYPGEQTREQQLAEFVQRLLKLNLRDVFRRGFCCFCGSLCTPRERRAGRCPNCASMRRAMLKIAKAAA